MVGLSFKIVPLKFTFYPCLQYDQLIFCNSMIFPRYYGHRSNEEKRAMNLQANISDGELTLIDEDYSVVIRQNIWMTQ